MTVERHEPEFTLDERPMLEGWLEYHRATLRWKCDGLTDAQLKERTVPPSSLSLLGLVRHMTEVERHWFVNRLDGRQEPLLYSTEQDPDADFNNLDSVSTEEVFRAWEEECSRARALARQEPSLDALSRGVGHHGQPFSLRWIMTHMIEEYARHNGHADLLRERIDGAVGD